VAESGGGGEQRELGELGKQGKIGEVNLELYLT